MKQGKMKDFFYPLLLACVGTQERGREKDMCNDKISFHHTREGKDKKRRRKRKRKRRKDPPPITSACMHRERRGHEERGPDGMNQCGH